jgi:arylsulfatase A-like enzyme
MLDAVRSSNLAAYGYQKRTTPHLDKLLPSCMLYENAISSSYWTMPSIASLFTGTYPSKHSLIYDGDTLDKQYTTIAEHLKKNGYQTYGICPHPYVSKYTDLNRGFDVFQDFSGYDKNLRNILFQKGKSVYKKIQHYNLTKRLVWNFITNSDQYAKKTNQEFASLLNDITTEKPFFCYIHYNEAHTPYIIPKSYRESFFEVKTENNPWEVNQDFIKYYTKESIMTDEDFHILKALYDGAIKYLDNKVHEIVLLLKDNDQWNNTILIITSDHGEQLGEHDLFFHVFSLYDYLIKVPLIIKYPSDLNLKGKIKNIVQNVDIFPTITDIINTYDKKLLGQFQGNSLVTDKIMNRNQKYAVSELIKPFGPAIMKHKDKLTKYDRKLHCIRTKNYKYIKSSDKLNEFYNLKDDPKENNNLLDIKSDTKELLKEELEYWIKTNLQYKRHE